MKQEEKRSYYRIKYTSSTCPIFKFADKHFEILDLSEQGFRFSIGIHTGITVEMGLSGSLTFKDGESFLIHGTVKRVVGNEISILLKKPLPLRKIMSEQQKLIASSAAVGIK